MVSLSQRKHTNSFFLSTRHELRAWEKVQNQPVHHGASGRSEKEHQLEQYRLRKQLCRKTPIIRDIRKMAIEGMIGERQSEADWRV